MADSWEDDDLVLPAVVPPKNTPVSWEDEEEEEEDKTRLAPGTAPKLSAAKAAKAAAQKQARVAAELETRLQIGETGEQRRLRERNRVEQEDNNLTEDLFGGARGEQWAGGIADIPLKSMEDHVKLAIELSERMASSKPAHSASFLKELVTKLAEKMTTHGLTDLINHTILFRDEKREAEERITAAKANASNTQAVQRANKKKNAKKKQAHADVFGDFDVDAIDNAGLDYESKFDDFM